MGKCYRGQAEGLGLPWERAEPPACLAHRGSPPQGSLPKLVGVCNSSAETTSNSSRGPGVWLDSVEDAAPGALLQGSAQPPRPPGPLDITSLSPCPPLHPSPPSQQEVMKTPGRWGRLLHPFMAFQGSVEMSTLFPRPSRAGPWSHSQH